MVDEFAAERVKVIEGAPLAPDRNRGGGRRLLCTQRGFPGLVSITKVRRGLGAAARLREAEVPEKRTSATDNDVRKCHERS